jgi:anhydro-N-acetylmuramic acid kinase
MNSDLGRLFKIGSKKSRIIIGLMSGTSMDGLDVALCRITNQGLDSEVKLLKFKTVSYSSEVRKRIGEVFAKQTIDFVSFSNLHPWIGILHGDMVLQCLKEWKVSRSSIDLIASHGQTVMHAPAFLHPNDPINSTIQAGDGDHIARKTGIITISDFRQKHIAAGGEGAPLAVYGDYLLLSHARENRILLNIGGIGNFTFLPAGFKSSEVFVTDTGPGNTLLDQVVTSLGSGQHYDKDSARAKKGKVHHGLLKSLKAHPFFSLPFPKTIGPELFNLKYVEKAKKVAKAGPISSNDLLATLTRFSAETIADAILGVTKQAKFAIYLSGGGAHNPLLVKWLSELLATELRSTDELGVPGDAKEAILFAILANETVAGNALDFGRRAKIPSVCMGKISFPN